MNKNWDISKAKSLYGIEKWGSGFFSINEAGNISVTPDKNPNNKIDLFKLTEDLSASGVRLPILIRFSNIIEERIKLLHNCFNNAIKEYGYKNKYTGVFPIKVNQQRHLVEEIVKYGQPYGLGLECGSKPELLITLALMNNPEAFIICNGFKDSEYIETALLNQKLGRQTFVVVDRMAEINLIINASKKLNVKPKIGFRCKLNAQGTGRWVESSGAKSKFGLGPNEIIRGVDMLKKANLLDCLELLHFHIGSQVPSIQNIKASIKEGARFYTELKKLALI